MELAKIEIDNVSAKFLTKHPIPCGVVGATINVRFMQSWNGLSKSAVFRYHGKQITQKITDNNITIPSECTEHVGERVWLGIIGTESSSPSLTPTVWADLGIVVNAADNTGDPAINPTLPIWAEIDAKIGDMSSLKTNNKDNIVSAINEVHDNSGGPGGEKEVIISTTEPPADSPESVWINPDGEPFSAADVPAVVPDGVTAEPNVQSVLDELAKPEGEWELIEAIGCGYEWVTEKPSDWGTNYGDYYTADYRAVMSHVNSAIIWGQKAIFKKAEYKPVQEIVRTAEPDGKEYAFKAMKIFAHLTPALNNPRYQVQCRCMTAPDKAASYAIHTVDKGQVVQTNGVQWVSAKFGAYEGNYASAAQNQKMYLLSEPYSSSYAMMQPDKIAINRVRINMLYEKAFPEGCYFEIWGVRK